MAVALALVVIYVARKYEAALIAERDYLRTVNTAFASAIDRLADELETKRKDR